MVATYSTFRPVTAWDRLLLYFGVEPDQEVTALDPFSLGLAPFIRVGESGSGGKVCRDVVYGLFPQWAEMQYGRNTFNSRCETVAQLRSFREAWRKGRRCIVPVEALFEPCYESGKPERCCLKRPGGEPMGVAGMWERMPSIDARWIFTFSMVTVKAASHPVYGRMNKPDQEKRMPVILDSNEYGHWLSCSVDRAPEFFRQWTGQLEMSAAPLSAALRASRAFEERNDAPPPESRAPS